MAAVIDSAGTWRMFTQIMLSLARPAVAVVLVITLIAGWKKFLWPLLVVQNQNLIPIDWLCSNWVQAQRPSINVQMAAMTITTLPVIVIFLLFQKQILKGVVLSSAKG